MLSIISGCQVRDFTAKVIENCPRTLHPFRVLSLSLYLSIHLSIYLSISFTRWKATLESGQSGTRYLFDAIFSLPISRRCNGRLCADEASRDSLLSVINEPGDCRCFMNKAIDRFRRRSPRDILLRTLTLLLCSTFHRPYTVSPPSETENSNKSLDIVTQFPFTVRIHSSIFSSYFSPDLPKSTVHLSCVLRCQGTTTQFIDKLVNRLVTNQSRWSLIRDGISRHLYR